MSVFKRSSGILLHIASLPGRYGIGDFGNAHEFMGFLQAAAQKFWQVLPLAPTGYGNSPYSAYSAFACNHYLLSPDLLVQRGLLTEKDFPTLPEFPEDRIDYGQAISYKMEILRKAFLRFAAGTNEAEQTAFNEFCTQQAHWIDDYALFMALKESLEGRPWNEWPEDIRLRSEESLAHYREALRETILFHTFLQFECSRQWADVRAVARQVGIAIIGDIPIFLAYDSADVWAHRDLFKLNTQGAPIVVTGVPPDYFSQTGQLWGNPHYNWQAMRISGFAWWKERFRRMAELYDSVRLDHFRGFEASYEIRAGAKDASKGRWAKVPGRQLFSVLVKEFPDLPVIAEDLGLITKEVVELRKHFAFPGMKVLQFGYESSNATSEFLPHNFGTDSVVYTGTHDNDTTLGWYRAAGDSAKQNLADYLGVNDEAGVCPALIKAAEASTAVIALIPIQDILQLGTEARMNFPGRPDGNWEFRMKSHTLTKEHADMLAGLVKLYNRWPSDESSIGQ